MTSKEDKEIETIIGKIHSEFTFMRNPIETMLNEYDAFGVGQLTLEKVKAFYDKYKQNNPFS